MGLFVRARLQHLAEWCDVKVISPVPALDYATLSNRHGVVRRTASGWRLDEALQVAHPRWFYLPGGGPLGGYLMAAQVGGLLQRLRREFPFDLIDAHFGHPEGVAAAVLSKRMGCPFLVTLRGHETMHARYYWRRQAIGWALRRADRVIAVSRRLADFAIELGAVADRVRVIGNGVDASVFAAGDREACRRRYGIGEGTRLLLSVGYLIERKGHHRAVEALAALPANAELWIAGQAGREGAFEARLRGMVAERGLEQRVRFLGSVPPATLAELMTAADALCLASSREGWPNVVQEALSCGLPVVATDIGAVPDLIPDERYGIVVPPGDAEALAAACRRALSTEWNRSEIATWGQSRSWGRVAEEVYEEVLAVCSETGGGEQRL